MNDKDMQLSTANCKSYVKVISKHQNILLRTPFEETAVLTGARALGMQFCKAMKFGAVVVFRILAALV